MSSQGADSGYISNGFPSGVQQDSAPFTNTLSEDWTIVSRRPDIPRLSIAAHEESPKHEQWAHGLQWAQEGPVIESRGKEESEYLRSSSSLDRIDCGTASHDVCADRAMLICDIRSAQVHLEMALQHDIDCRTRSLAAIKHLSSLPILPTHQSKIDWLLAEHLQTQCSNDATILSEQHNSVLEAKADLELALKKLAHHECHVEGQDSLHEDAMSDASCDSSRTPSALAIYFDLAGQEFVLDERIAEMDVEHNEQLASCQESHNGFQMQELFPQNEGIYRLRRQELVEARKTIHRELQIQRDVCLSQGIDPERYRYRRMTADCQSAKTLDVLQSLRQSAAKPTLDTVTSWLQQSGS